MFDFLTTKFSSVFSYVTGKRYLTEKNLSETIQKVEEALIQADVPLHVVQAFIGEIKQEVLGKQVLKSLNPGEQFAKIVHEKLVAFLGNKKEWHIESPAIIMVMGLQGSGKTTTLAKLAHFIQKNYREHKNNAILLGSVDFYRPAAIEQLAILAKKINIACYQAQQKDPVAAAREIIAYGKQNKKSCILLDTAGRLHVDQALLRELSEIYKIIKPTNTILVLDAMTGQESLTVAKSFHDIIPFDGAILTKIDSDTRAGAAFAFCYELHKPILFLGSGEKVEDLEVFKPDRIAGRMLGMGDVQTLLEKANEKITKEEQIAAEKSFAKSSFTLYDFAQQLDMMNRLGSISSLMRYIPGMSMQKIDTAHLQEAEKEMKKFKAIITSMTLKEQVNPKILDNSRKTRIARGAGVAVADINLLLRRFEEMQQYAKLFKRMGKF